MKWKNEGHLESYTGQNLIHNYIYISQQYALLFNQLHKYICKWENTLNISELLIGDNALQLFMKKR